jgi:hypothetical protein
VRALTALAAGALLLAGCETAFVGRAPEGAYQLVQVNGNALPYGQCPGRISSGQFDVDSVARRFEMRLDRGCPSASETVERGSYLRRGGRLELEAGGRTLEAWESGGTITLSYEGLRLRFRKPR